MEQLCFRAMRQFSQCTCFCDQHRLNCGSKFTDPLDDDHRFLEAFESTYRGLKGGVVDSDFDPKAEFDVADDNENQTARSIRSTDADVRSESENSDGPEESDVQSSDDAELRGAFEATYRRLKQTRVAYEQGSERD